MNTHLENTVSWIIDSLRGFFSVGNGSNGLRGVQNTSLGGDCNRRSNRNNDVDRIHSHDIQQVPTRRTDVPTPLGIITRRSVVVSNDGYHRISSVDSDVEEPVALKKK
jgi:hypothetical protein